MIRLDFNPSLRTEIAKRLLIKIAYAAATITLQSMSYASDSNLYLMDLTTNASRPITDNSKDNFSPTWSPDGSKIAFVSQDKQSSRILIWNKDTNQTRNASTYETLEYQPSWNPTSEEIAYVAAMGPRLDIMVVNVSTNARECITCDLQRNSSNLLPVWSDDGTKIAYLAEQLSDSTWKLCVFDRKTEEHKLLQEVVQPYVSMIWTNEDKAILAAHSCKESHRPAFTRIDVITKQIETFVSVNEPQQAHGYADTSEYLWNRATHTGHVPTLQTGKIDPEVLVALTQSPHKEPCVYKMGTSGQLSLFYTWKPDDASNGVREYVPSPQSNAVVVAVYEAPYVGSDTQKHFYKLYFWREFSEAGDSLGNIVISHDGSMFIPDRNFIVCSDFASVFRKNDTLDIRYGAGIFPEVLLTVHDDGAVKINEANQVANLLHKRLQFWPSANITPTLSLPKPNVLLRSNTEHQVLQAQYTCDEWLLLTVGNRLIYPHKDLEKPERFVCIVQTSTGLDLVKSGEEDWTGLLARVDKATRAFVPVDSSYKENLGVADLFWPYLDPDGNLALPVRNMEVVIASKPSIEIRHNEDGGHSVSLQ